MTRKQVKINNTSSIRDLHSKAILETNQAEYLAHLRRRDREKQTKNLDDKMTKILALLEKNGLSLDDL